MAALYSLNKLLSTQDTYQIYAFHSVVASFPLQPLAHLKASMNPSSETAGNSWVWSSRSCNMYLEGCEMQVPLEHDRWEKHFSEMYAECEKLAR